MTESLERLAALLQKLPGIGPRTATRLTHFILTLPRGYCTELATALTAVAGRVKNCPICCNWTESDPCSVCADSQRDERLICLVEHPKNIRAVEATGFRGRYHVLGGVISPLAGIGPEQLRIEELLQRIPVDETVEVIFALSPRLEADTTVDYLQELLQRRRPRARLTRPAAGLPVGSDLEYADAMTLYQALHHRRELPGESPP